MSQFSFRKPIVVGLVALLALTAGATAGSLTPPGAVSSTMNSLADLYASIAGTFDSSGIASSTTGSLIQHLKYIENNLGWASNSFGIYTVGSGNVGIGTSTPAGLLSLQQPNNTANMLVANRFSDNSTTSGSFFKLRGANNQLIALLDTKGSFTSNIASISPSIVGSVTDAQLDGADAVAISGRYAYVTALNADRFTIVDIADPTSPSIRGSVTSTQLDGANSVTVSGRYAYVTALNDDRLVVIDVSNPTSPTIVGSVASGTFLDAPDGVRVSGRYAYVAAGNSDALTVIDISDPENLTIAGSVTAASLDGANDLYLVGGYAYVSAGNGNRLTVVDISDPTELAVVGSLQDNTNLAGIQSVYVSGRYAYTAAATNSRMTVVDISNPTSPVVVGSVADTTFLAGTTWVTVAGRYAYLTAQSGARMTIVDISRPLSPTIVGSVRSATNLGLPRAVFVSGKYAYVTGFGSDRLNVIDVTGFDIPTLVTGSIQTSTLGVLDNADIGNNLNVRSGLNVGAGGANIDGAFSVTSSSYFGDSVSIFGGIDESLHISNTDGNPYAIMINNLTYGPDDSTGLGIYQSNDGNGHFDIDGAGLLTLETIGRILGPEFLGFNVDPGDNRSAIGGIAVINDTTLASQDVVAISGGISFRASSGTTNRVTAGSFVSVMDTDAIGTVNTAIGINGGIQILGATSVGDAYGGLFSVLASGSGVLTNAYGINISSLQIEGAGTTDNNYGIYINDQAGLGTTLNYNLYSAGTGTNYFGGNIGVGGATDPNSFLNIQTPDASDAITINNAVFGTAGVDSFALSQGDDGTGHLVVADGPSFDFESDGTFFAQHTNGYVNNPGSFQYAISGAANVLDSGVAGGVIVAANGQAVFSDSTGTTNTTVGGQFETITDGTGGTVTNAYGLSGSVNGVGSTAITNAIGGSFAVISSISTAVTNAYALRIGNRVGLGSSITNNYGLYIDPQAGIGDTLNYNLYSAGTALNYFGGPVQVNLSGAQTTFAVCHPNNGQTNTQELVDCDTPVGDYMELYPMDASTQEGDIVMADGTRFATSTENDQIPVLVKASNRNQILGIVSVASKAGDFNSVGHNIRKADNPLPLALNGRVKVNVNMQNGSISVGDPITLSSTPGVGAKAVDAGFIVGTALGAATQDGMVMVYVRPTYWAPSVPAVSGATPDSQSLIGAVIEYLRNAVLAVKELVSPKVTTDKLQMHDSITGQVYCVTIANGDFAKTSGECDALIVTPTPSDVPSDTPTPTPQASIEPTPEETP